MSNEESGVPNLKDLPPDRIVLVVDRGLVRLAKVLSLALAVVAALGVAFFDVNIYSAKREIDDDLSTISEKRKDLEAGMTVLASRLQQLDETAGKIEKKQAEVEAAANEVSQLRQTIYSMSQEVAKSWIDTLSGDATDGRQMAFYDKLITSAQTNPALEPLLPFLFRGKANMHCSPEESSVADSFFRKAETAAAMNNDFREQAETFLDWSYCKRDLNNLEGAVWLLDKAASLGRQIEDHQLEGQALLTAGVVLEQERKYGDAKDALRKARDVFSRGSAQTKTMRVWEAHALRNLANVYSDQNEIATALDHYRQAMAIYEAENATQSMQTLHAKIGDVVRETDPILAVRHYCEAARLYGLSVHAQQSEEGGEVVRPELEVFRHYASGMERQGEYDKLCMSRE